MKQEKKDKITIWLAAASVLLMLYTVVYAIVVGC
tara:strand:+ start:7111 stop:7212 length:102 start_codon:yes stop_codon:yes gene_type:complete